MEPCPVPSPIKLIPRKDPNCVLPLLAFPTLFHLPPPPHGSSFIPPPSLDGFVTSFHSLASHPPSPTCFPLLLSPPFLLSEPLFPTLTWNIHWDMPQLSLTGVWTVQSQDPRLFHRTWPFPILTLSCTSPLELDTGNESLGTVTPGHQSRGAPRAQGGPLCSQLGTAWSWKRKGKKQTRAGSQAPKSWEPRPASQLLPSPAPP